MLNEHKTSRWIAGDTIVEVMIAMAIVGFLLASVFTLTNRTTHNVRQSTEHQEALKYISSQLEQLNEYLRSDTNSKPTGTFCIDKTSLTVVAVPAAGPVPAACVYGTIPGGYEITLTYDVTTHVYTAKAKWQGATGNVDGVSLVYRVEKKSGSYSPDIGAVVTSCVPVSNLYDLNAGDFHDVFAAGAGASTNSSTGVPGAGTDPAAGFNSDLPNRGPNVYPDDAPNDAIGQPKWTGGYSLEGLTAADTVTDPLIPVGTPAREFGGTGSGIIGFQLNDTTRGVQSNTFFYSNPNAAKSDGVGFDNIAGFSGRLWYTTIPGPLITGKTYVFTTYFLNLLPPFTLATGAAEPQVELQVNGASVGSMIVDNNPSPVIGHYYVPPDRTWHAVQIPFVAPPAPGNVNVQLAIYDYAANIIGDDFGMTGVSFNKCAG